jgi:hypothetical protein
MLGIPPVPDRLEPPGAERLSYRYGYLPCPPIGIIPLGIGIWILGFVVVRALPKLWAGVGQDLGSWPLRLLVTVVALLFAAAWIAMGSVLTFHRSGVIFRRSPRTATTWWKLLWLLRTKIHSLDEYDAVEVVWRTGHRGRRVYYYLVVRGTDRPDIQIGATLTGDQPEAERMAAEVRTLLDFK